jgi:hypothetical protein
MKILDILKDRHKQGKKSVAVLVDPDKIEGPGKIKPLLNLASENCVDFFFVGGSLITTSNLSEVVQEIKENVGIPVVLFPGNSMQPGLADWSACGSGAYLEEQPHRSDAHRLYPHQLGQDHFRGLHQQHHAYPGR